jgi:hypothetical protein
MIYEGFVVMSVCVRTKYVHAFFFANNIYAAIGSKRGCSLEQHLPLLAANMLLLHSNDALHSYLPLFLYNFSKYIAVYL